MLKAAQLYSVLIVDDESEIREVLVQRLSAAGFMTREAANAAEALVLILESDFDVVVTDIKMPKSTGLDLLHHIRKYRPRTRVLLMSGNDSVGDPSLTVLSKPFSLAEFDRCVQVACRESRESRIEKPARSDTAAPASPTVLIVEDSEAERQLFKKALVEINSPVSFTFAVDGIDATAYLTSTIRSRILPPALILLDLNLPRLDGHEVIAKVKGTPKLAHIPIVVLTASSAPEDVRRAYELGASSYHTKPLDLGEFYTLIEKLLTSWLDHAPVPRRRLQSHG